MSQSREPEPRSCRRGSRTTSCADDDVVETVEVIDEEAATDEAPEVVPAVVLPVAVDRPVQTVGRRKEAVVRIRLDARATARSR